MLQAPIHSMSAARSPQQRFATVLIVGGLHIAAITALILGLRAFFTFEPPRKDLTVTIPTTTLNNPPEPRKHEVILIKPEGPVIPAPQNWQIKETPPQTGPGGNGIATAPTSVFAGAVAIASTHTTPAYPPLDVRLGHVGNVMLRLSIDENGKVVGATVERTSGFDSLDAAAVNWVVAHWRYQPATRDGVRVASTADAIVTFRLTGREF